MAELQLHRGRDGPGTGADGRAQSIPAWADGAAGHRYDHECGYGDLRPPKFPQTELRCEIDPRRNGQQNGWRANRRHQGPQSGPLASLLECRGPPQEQQREALDCERAEQADHRHDVCQYEHAVQVDHLVITAPPETSRIAPVIQSLSDEARNKAVRATSSGDPRRLRGCESASCACSPAGIILKLRSVRIVSGAMQFTRTLWGPI